MKLVPINIDSIYPIGKGGPLPMPMAQMAEDAAASLKLVRKEIEAKGGLFRVSDMFRTHDQQVRAHNDWKFGRKKAYSPPAGGSMHEAGRAIDVDLAVLIHPPSVPKGYRVFSWTEVKEIFIRHGWTPIEPGGSEHSVDRKEKWHFDYRGKFDAVYKKAPSNKYHAMAAAAIADLDIYQKPGSKPGLGTVPSANASATAMLLRLGYTADTKGIKQFQREHHLDDDGVVGPLTGTALSAAVRSLPAK